MACMCLASLGVEARSMKDLLVSMPDTLMPTLDKSLRLEFAELQEMGVKAEVKNLLGEVSVMDTLTADFVQIRMSQVSSLQMKKLPADGGDSLLCVVKTFAAPEKESVLYLFDQNWNQKDASHLFLPKLGALDVAHGDGAQSLSHLSGYLIQKPDTMEEERFAQLEAMIEPRMVSAVLFQHDNSIVVSLASPLLSAEDKKQVNAIKLQRKFNWSSGIFKES